MMLKQCPYVLIFIFSLYVTSGIAITGPTHGKIVVCYVGTWAVYRPERGSFALENVDPTLCTHIIYSFAGLNVTSDSMRPLDPWQDLTEDYGKGGYNRIVKMKERYPHLKVTIAIGGWNEGSSNYSKMAADPQRRTRFVRNALEFVKKYNFDGLDLDWEFPGKRGGTPNDKANFILLVKELRAAFNKDNLLLTAALGAGKDTIDIAYDVGALSIYLDYIHMMCYDYHGAWDSKTGANAPLKGNDVLTVEYTINYMLQMGAPPSKLVMGIPLYGRTFFTTDSGLTAKKRPQLGVSAETVGFQGPFTREDGFMGYNEICLQLKNTTVNWTKHWDDESRTPFLISEEKVITYDDERSISEKVRFAMEKNLAGLMVWSIDTDDFKGDCSEESTGFTNFPLMRTINKATEESLESIRVEKENEIPHGDNKNEPSSARTLVSNMSVVVLSVITLLKC